jgi:hypothetical protein
MSGSQKNSWSSYLNGGTSQYNFSYKDDISLPNPSNISLPNTPPSPFANENTKNIKNKKIGGKRKSIRSKRHTKKNTTRSK